MKTLPVNFSDLALALEDQGGELHVYYFDTDTGEMLNLSEDIDQAQLHQIREHGSGRFLPIEPMSPRQGYQIMADFVRELLPSRVREKLEWSLDGPKPFRRFKTALREDDAIRRQWFDFHAARMREFAIEWLLGHNIRPEGLNIQDPRYHESAPTETVTPGLPHGEAQRTENDQFERPPEIGEEDLFEPDSEQEKTKLLEFIESFPEKSMSLAKLHGLYSALAAGPVPVLQGDLLSILGIVSGKLPIKDSEHAAQIAILLSRFYSEIVADIASESFVPRLQPESVAVTDIVSDMASWCQGFVLGMEQDRSARRPWFNDPRRKKAISFITGTAQLQERPDTASAELSGWNAHSLISDLVPLIASYWRFESGLDDLIGAHPVITESQMGRDQPCPVGAAKSINIAAARLDEPDLRAKLPVDLYTGMCQSGIVIGAKNRQSLPINSQPKTL
jgi:yecA family protein